MLADAFSSRFDASLNTWQNLDPEIITRTVPPSIAAGNIDKVLPVLDALRTN
jgi:hypothetical protein